MSCIRFNTTAMKSQLDQARNAGVGDDPVASFLSPAITESKIARIVTMSQDANPKIRESAALSYHAPLAVYEKLARDSDEGVRSCLARNHTSPTVQKLVAWKASLKDDAELVSA